MKNIGIKPDFYTSAMNHFNLDVGRRCGFFNHENSVAGRDGRDNSF